MMEINVGSCEFCGKTMMIESSSKLDEVQANELATRRCDCEKSQGLREYAAVLEKADELFGEGASENGFTRESQVVILAVARLAEMIYAGQISECVVTLTCGDKAKIVMKKGVLKITRTRKIERTEDVDGGTKMPGGGRGRD